jgi:heme oxygenase
MLDIKELTLEQHKNAERQEFVRTLMSGNIDHNLYATYLYNQYHCYRALEDRGIENSLFVDTPNLPRADRIRKDYQSLWKFDDTPILTQSTVDYIKHIELIKESAESLYAHIYVRHLGDLSGGQMIRRKTPGPNNYYFFRPDEYKYKEIVKEKINTYLNIYQHTVLPEARLCFDYATKLFGEMNDLGKTD